VSEWFDIYRCDVVTLTGISPLKFQNVLAETYVRGLLEKYPTFGREKETGLLGALDT